MYRKLANFLRPKSQFEPSQTDRFRLFVPAPVEGSADEAKPVTNDPVARAPRTDAELDALFPRRPNFEQRNPLAGVGRTKASQPDADGTAKATADVAASGTKLGALFPRLQGLFRRTPQKEFESLQPASAESYAGLAAMMRAIATPPIHKNEDKNMQLTQRLMAFKDLAKQVDAGTLATHGAVSTQADHDAAQALDRLLTLNKGSNEKQQLHRVENVMKAARADDRIAKKAARAEVEALKASVAQTGQAVAAITQPLVLGTQQLRQQSRARLGLEMVAPAAQDSIALSGVYAELDAILQNPGTDQNRWNALQQVYARIEPHTFERYDPRRHAQVPQLDGALQRVLKTCSETGFDDTTGMALVRKAVADLRPVAEAIHHRAVSDQQSRAHTLNIGGAVDARRIIEPATDAAPVANAVPAAAPQPAPVASPAAAEPIITHTRIRPTPARTGISSLWGGRSKRVGIAVGAGLATAAPTAPIAAPIAPIAAPAAPMAASAPDSAIPDATPAPRMDHAGRMRAINEILGEADKRTHHRPGRIAKFFGAVDPLDAREGGDFAAKVVESRRNLARAHLP